MMKHVTMDCIVQMEHRALNTQTAMVLEINSVYLATQQSMEEAV